MACCHLDTLLIPVAYEKLTGLDSAKGITAELHTGTNRMLVQCLIKNIRWRDVGDDPTATEGVQLAAGDSFWYIGNDLTAIKFIEEVGGAEINVVSYHEA